MAVEYFTPEEISKNKEYIKQSLDEQGASPVVKSGLAQRITAEFVKSKSDSILDCGPGAGSFLKSIQADGYQNIYAVDIDNYLSFNGVKELRKADLSFEKIPWQDSSFEAVTAWQLMEHLENPHNFIREAHRVLKPGGLFIISMPNVQHIFNKFFFMRKGDMYRWHKRNNHIALFPRGLFHKAFLKYFEVAAKRFTEGELPYRFFDKYKFPSNELFGRDVIYILKKI